MVDRLKAFAAWCVIALAAVSCTGARAHRADGQDRTGSALHDAAVDVESEAIPFGSSVDPSTAADLYCQPSLEALCAFRSQFDRLGDPCDLSPGLATLCAEDDDLVLHLNTCGGLTRVFGETGFGGESWYYNRDRKLVGVDLHSDTNQYCGEFSLHVGRPCETLAETLAPCVH